MGGELGLSLYARMYVCIYACVCLYMDECMHVCIYVNQKQISNYYFMLVLRVFMLNATIQPTKKDLQTLTEKSQYT